MNIKKKIMALAVVAFTFTFVGCSNSQSTNKINTSTSQNDTQESKIDFENAFIVDVRTPSEFASGHFEGAVNIPLNEINNQLEAFEGKDQIIVYCRSGARSGSAKVMLEQHGISNIINGVNLNTMEKLKKNNQ